MATYENQEGDTKNGLIYVCSYIDLDAPSLDGVNKEHTAGNPFNASSLGLTRSTVNYNGFGVRLKATAANGDTKVEVRNIRVTLYHTIPAGSGDVYLANNLPSSLTSVVTSPKTGTKIITSAEGFLLRRTTSDSQWNMVTPPLSATYYKVKVQGKIFVAIGERGSIIKSTDDGVTWKVVQTGLPNTLFDLIFEPSNRTWRMTGVDDIDVLTPFDLRGMAARTNEV
jgi:hypothetical protein